MIVVDTSVLVAIVRGEPEARGFVRTLSGPAARIMPASAYLEATMVLSNKPSARAALDEAIKGLDIVIVAVDEAIIRLAADAFERYGKGRGHRAQLNFGDCMAYATAKARNAPLLFKGEDFALTDLTAAD